MSMSFKPVEAVSRALSVLRAVNAHGPASVATIHSATDIDKATIVRMLETLVHEGYVAKDGNQPFYYATGRTLLLSQGYDLVRSIAAASGPVLGEYRAKVGWPSDVAVFDNDAMVIAGSTRTSSVLSFNRPTGFRLPMLATSAGLAYVAFAEPDRRETILARLRDSREPLNQLASDRDAAEALFESIRAKGYAVMSDEYSERISGGALWAMAVPVFSGGDLRGAVNLILIRNAVSEKDAVKKYLPSLKKVAKEVGVRLQEFDR